MLCYVSGVKLSMGSFVLFARDLVGTNWMMCEECGSEVGLTHIDENYVTHGICTKC